MVLCLRSSHVWLTELVGRVLVSMKKRRCFSRGFSFLS